MPHVVKLKLCRRSGAVCVSLRFTVRVGVGVVGRHPVGDGQLLHLGVDYFRRRRHDERRLQQ